MKVGEYQIAEFKAVSDGPKRGLFAALVSVFGNVDRSGDRMMKGAFTKSIKRWMESGRPIPVIWSHEWKDPHSYIGQVNPADVKETDKGLVVAGKLDIEDNPNALKIYDLLASGRLKEWSFGYEVLEERIAKDLARDLLEVDLIEVGPTLKGANPQVATLAMKNAVAVEAEAETESKAVDGSAWDGSRAMGACSSAADYRSICAGERSAGEPDERQHWALPHHYLGRGPNAGGVRNALSRLPQTQGLSNRASAESHLQRHMGEVSPKAVEPEEESPLEATTVTTVVTSWDPSIEQKIGRVISSKTESRLRRIQQELEEILAQVGEEEEQATPEKASSGEEKALRLGIEEAGFFLAERK
jgi:HK97 family phage prohead protease